jgi:hypothetical protein
LVVRILFGLCLGAVVVSCTGKQAAARSDESRELLLALNNTKALEVDLPELIRDADLKYLCVLDEYLSASDALAALSSKGEVALSIEPNVDVQVPEGSIGLLVVAESGWRLLLLKPGLISNHSAFCYSRNSRFVKNADRSWTVVGNSLLF